MSVKSARGAAAVTWRRRVPVLAVVAACAAAVVAAVTGVANPVSAVEFLSPGHWVYNVASGTAFHVDGSTSRVDAEVGVDGHPGSGQVVQGETSGFVVGDSRYTEFGKSSLHVVDVRDAPVTDELPVALEVSGGPYLVYRRAGVVVRLGGNPGVMPAGGSVGDPVATPDGTVWVPRTDAGLLCRVSRSDTGMSCPTPLPAGARGGLTVVGGKPVFVDTTHDRLHPVEPDGLGAPRAAGVDIPDTAKVAQADIEGRIAVLDPDGPGMVLLDSAGMDPARSAGDPVDVALTAGEWDGPVAAGRVVAVLDRATDTVTTYDSGGTRVKDERLAPEAGEPRLARGEDGRVYVDGAQGEHVLVVDRDGAITPVDIGAPDEQPGGGDRTGAEEREEPPPPAPPTTTQAPQPPQPQQPPRTNDRRVERAPERPTQDAAPPAQDVPPAQDGPPATTRPVEPPPTTTPPPPPPPPPLPATPPGAPPGVTATAGNASAVVNWGEAAPNRSPVTAYTVTWRGAGGRNGTLNAAGGARTATVGGLTNGVAYSFTVSATNAAGTGAATAAASPVTPTAPTPPPGTGPGPGPVTGLVVDYDRQAGTAQLSWNEPDLRGYPLRHYTVKATGAENQYIQERTATFTGIPDNGGTVTFSVRADSTGPDDTTQTGETVTHDEPATPGGGGGGGTIRISRGAQTTEYCGDLAPDCAWMRVVLDGFEPGTTVELMPHSSDPAYSNPGSTQDTDGGGGWTGELFAYGSVGREVYVTAELPDGTVIESNHITWEAG
ncbi:fibronectin type III domain-containing protein [Actinokineospora bangkokensis]|uniref:Fibronectin type-III domain-containing protein n=1 Tax=Actinokineospora bangkokensis TaxID=1193682 RepID=A0A1Q9LTC5_9PSEU|nr:fibronectin type III domain-containing protein [Actinokineospora bangkokensis]OLR95286.1 hypothetical protein BJP25_07330 [Actinokineospora bangkokensis]